MGRRMDQDAVYLQRLALMSLWRKLQFAKSTIVSTLGGWRRSAPSSPRRLPNRESLISKMPRVKDSGKILEEDRS